MARHEAEAAAAQLLLKHGVTTVPVPVEWLAEAEGALVVRQRFDGDQSGFVYRQGNHRIIGVNSATSLRRQRFTLAHECGHMLLHQSSDGALVDREMNFRNRVSSLAIDPIEIEANAFAAALLMPRDQIEFHVEQAIQRHDIGSRERLIAYLAGQFDVSSEAMSYRLINLGIYS
jgi:Zn-dependent peptidase ImmA (M78 family)